VEGFTGKSGNKTAVFDLTYNDNYPIYKIYRGTRAGAYDTFFMIMPSEANIKSTGINKLNYRDNLKGLRPGSTYYYAAAAMDFFGREGQKSSEVSIRIQDLSPPPMIQGIRASFEKDDAIYLRWRKPHPSITSLKIYRSNQRSTGYSVIANPVDSFYIDKSFDRKSNYYFVEATNDNNISSFTDTITCIPPDFDPPATPMNFRATADTGNIYLSWDANTESDLAGYLIFKALSTDSQNFSPIFPEAIRSNSYTDREPKEAGNFLIYKICAMDKSYNRSAVSASIAVRMPNIVAPKPSTIVELENENGEVQLSWTPNREPDFMRYDVYRGTPVDDSTFGDYKLVATTRETSYRDKTNEQNKTYSYYIRVLDSSNNFSNSPPRLVQANRPKNAEAIQNFNVSATENSIRIVWRSGSQNVQLFRKTQTNYYAITPVAQFEKFEDKDVSKGNAYSYKIVSYGEENQVQSEEKRIEF
jgi:fibronectin type 3 domain-containing protein